MHAAFAGFLDGLIKSHGIFGPFHRGQFLSGGEGADFSFDPWNLSEIDHAQRVLVSDDFSFLSESQRE